MESEFDKMFAEREAKKQKERESHTVKDAQHQAFRDRATNIIKTIIAPILEAAAADLRKRGHEATASGSDERASYPSAQLSFRVSDSDPHSDTSASKLTFATTSTETQFEARKEIWGRKGKLESSGYGGGGQVSRAIDKVDEGWVKNEALSFIKSVLEET